MYGELMSRIGKKPIAVPNGVKVEQKGRAVKVSGPNGTLEMTCVHEIDVKIDEQAGQITVENSHPQSRRHKSLHGTMRSLLNNMVIGTSKKSECNSHPT